MSKPWDLKTQFLNTVKHNGGFVNCHGHWDKSFYISKETLNDSMLSMETKWNMSDSIKQADTQDSIQSRIQRSVDIMISQGSTIGQTFIDAYDAVGHKAIDASLEIKKQLNTSFTIKTATQPLGGLRKKEAINLYEAITEKADIAGGLPSYDRPHHEENFDRLFSIAKNLNKPIHCHIDQENNPNEHDTELLIEFTKKYGYEGRVTAVHAVSTAAQPKAHRTRVYKELADLGIAVVVCPSGALSMRQHDEQIANIHNSIAHVPELLEAGVLVGLGVDNICDFYQPFVDGDMWVEIRMLMEACRFYDFDALVQICTQNGRSILERK